MNMSCQLVKFGEALIIVVELKKIRIQHTELVVVNLPEIINDYRVSFNEISIVEHILVDAMRNPLSKQLPVSMLNIAL